MPHRISAADKQGYITKQAFVEHIVAQQKEPASKLIHSFELFQSIQQHTLFSSKHCLVLFEQILRLLKFSVKFLAELT